MTKDEAIVYINALRNGVPPTRDLNATSTGRHDLLVAIKRDLETAKTSASAVKFITGECGCGKSYMCQQYKEIALERDYVVSYFQTNQGFRLNKIEDLYYAIMHNLYVRVGEGKKVAFETLFDLWTDQMAKGQTSKEASFEINAVCTELSKYNYTYARVFLSFMKGRLHKKPEQMNTAAAWLCGEGNIPYTLKEKYDLVGQVKKYDSLDFLKAFNQLVQFIGYKGLVVIIDDMSLILEDRKDLRQSGYDILKYLCDLTCMGDLVGINFILSGDKQWLTDPKKGLQTHRGLKERLNLKVHPEKGLIPSHSVYDLDHLTPQQKLALTKKITSIYGLAYNFRQPLDLGSLYLHAEAVIKAAGIDEGSTRNYVMALIEVLDAIERTKFTHMYAKKHPHSDALRHSVGAIH